MQNYHNGDVDFEEAWDLAIQVNNEVDIYAWNMPGQISEMVDIILENPNFILYDRNSADVYLEKAEASFIAMNERVDPTPSGI